VGNLETDKVPHIRAIAEPPASC